MYFEKLILQLILVLTHVTLISFSKSPHQYKGIDNGQERAQDNEWTYVMSPMMKRCDFREINVMCYDEIPTSSTICQINCEYRGYSNGICHTEPGPGNQPSGEWTRARGKSFCYCTNCHNDKCKEYCYNFGFATGYCHLSNNYGTQCKCVGCDGSTCNGHCNSVYGFSLEQSFCRNNDCKCYAKSCSNY